MSASVPLPVLSIQDIATPGEYGGLPWFGDLLACERCLCRREATRVVPGVGPLTAGIGFFGQNPGEEEDTQGSPFVGRSGDELSVWITAMGLARSRVLLSNVVRCHTTNNRVPRHSELQACAFWSARELEDFPSLQVLISLGRPALQGLIGKTERGLPGIFEPWWVRATLGGSREFLVLPLPHPAYILRLPRRRDDVLRGMLPAVVRYLKELAPDAYALSR